MKRKSIEFKFTEGGGGYKGVPMDKLLHPKGRMGAKLEVFVNDVLVYVTLNSSTLPDSLDKNFALRYNDGMAIPVLKNGTYHGKIKYMSNGYKGIKITNEESENSANVIRNLQGFYSDTSSGIYIHKRPTNDPKTYASSCGCITVLEPDLLVIFDMLDTKHKDDDILVTIIRPQNYAQVLENRLANPKHSNIDMVYNPVEEVPSKYKIAWDKAVKAGVEDGLLPNENVTAAKLMCYFDKMGILDNILKNQELSKK